MYDFLHLIAVDSSIDTSMSSLVINGHRLTLGLVSRRSRERAGTRYFSRGLDEVGHASNFVETEQIVITEQHTMSFVQTRGSAPLIWGQLINTRYTPQLWIDAGDKVTDNCMDIIRHSRYR